MRWRSDLYMFLKFFRWCVGLLPLVVFGFCTWASLRCAFGGLGSNGPCRIELGWLPATLMMTRIWTSSTRSLLSPSGTGRRRAYGTRLGSMGCGLGKLPPPFLTFLSGRTTESRRPLLQWIDIFRGLTL